MVNQQPPEPIPEPIPYSSWLNEEQNAITNEMSNYGSDLTTQLASCGVVCCLGATAGCLMNKYCRNHEPGSKYNPIVVEDYVNNIQHHQFYDENDSEPNPMEELYIKNEPNE